MQTRTGESSAAHLAQFKSDINTTDKIVLSQYPWQFLETTKSQSTVASQIFYKIPNSVQRVASVTTVVGSITYRPKKIESVQFWEYLQSLRIAVSSNITQFYFRQGNQIGLWPTPQSVFTMTIRGRKATPDLSLADYTTGNIVSVANAGVAVVGSGTSWAAGSVGNFIRVGYTAGDFRWYEIDSIGSTTGLTLVDPYEGTSIAAGSASYTIGEFSAIPGEYHDILLSRPLAKYYSMMENQAMAKQYWLEYDGGVEAGFTDVLGGTMQRMFERYSENFEGVYLDEEQPVDPSTADLLVKNFGYSGEGW